MAWFMRHGATSGTTGLYIMGAPSGGFRLFTNGIAGRGLYQRTILASGGNGTNASIPNDFYLPAATADIQTLAANSWVHVAMVIDAVAQTADWYVNGVSVLKLNNVGGALINAAGPFQVGYYSSASEYDLDEFLMSFRAYSPPEILALSLASRAGDGPYGSGIASQCGTATLGSTGGRPFLGNAGYALRIGSTAIGTFGILIGATRCSTGSGMIPLPFDLSIIGTMGTGCWLLADPIISASGGIAGSPVTVPLPVPSSTALMGLSLYSQGVVYDAIASKLLLTYGWASGVGG